MALIKSISGIRGTIGGKVSQNLTPMDIVEMTSAYGTWLLSRDVDRKVVLGRDGRISGEIVSDLVIATLRSLGIDVVDLGFSTTPTVEMMVEEYNAGGGIILTASHNPKEWNALKLLNEKGEFISAEDGAKLLEIAQNASFDYADVDNLGLVVKANDSIEKHIKAILDLDYIDVSAIQKYNFKVVVDCINSTGAISIPPLLERLSCEYVLINDEVSGDFAHTPEPIPENLSQLSEAVVEHKAHIGIAVDPDVDRLVLVCENGEMFSEEYTIVAVADFILRHQKGALVSNMSSSRALSDIAKKYNQDYFASAVGEVNVVKKMKSVNAVFGGEGNGGVILPDLHYGRDALVGIALILNLLADENISLSALKSTYPSYEIIKTKIKLTPDLDVDALIQHVKGYYLEEELNEEDGLKIDFANGWVHLRKSNTEPIVRIIAESTTKSEAERLIEPILTYINEFK